MSINKILVVISLVFILTAAFLWGYMWWQDNSTPLIAAEDLVFVEPDLPLLELTPVPIASTEAAQSSSSPTLTAQAAYALDLASGVPLFAKNANTSLPPASSIKMMTALIAMETYALDEVITITPQDLTSSNAINLVAGEQLTVADLIQAMLVNSSNESAQALANHSPQGAAEFMNQMNARARKLSLENTAFVSPEGFDYGNQYASARDLAILAKELLQDPYLSEIVSLPRTTILAATGQIHELDNTNKFLAQPPVLSLADGRRLPTAFSGIKTGTTPAAGEVLVTLATVDGHQLILAVLGSRDRYADSQKLLTWIFNNYQWAEFAL